MAAPAEIVRLVETFERNKESYRQGGLNEAQLRQEFLNPFFKALAWDVDNTQGWAEPYKEVIHEDAIRIESSLKAPDYCFRIGGTRKFFVEAKAPSVNVKDAIEPAYQLRRYAWSAKLPLSILTNFGEFAVYDCRVRPDKTDKPSKARIIYLRYMDYAGRWEEIASIFSRDAVLKGSFDKYAVTEKRKHGTAEVDVAFLAEIESWREALAHNIALRNPGLSNRQLNYAVQITIDRIIFLRICEDRGVERYGELMSLLNGQDVYGRMMGLFRKADDRYNSGLFHFLPEKDRPEGPDELTPEIVVDDKPLKDILHSLYYPDSPYEFSVLPTEILGQVYEQFLGKVITLTLGHHARVEDKPEVKKAGGVFYTPAYIVDYIVKQTVGKLLEGASVKITEIRQEKDGKTKRLRVPVVSRSLRILDPACGSGSFLLGAYQLLLDWYRAYYEQNDPEKWAGAKVPPIYQAGTRGWKLTLAERKRILLDHIFGVDIDPQAVEVTKLSLLLRVLEGEKDLVLFHHERALPDLAGNIKCGNSLIGPDFYIGQQLTFDEEECYRVNAFDWHDGFPDIFKEGGFDAVIGNPPYVLLRDKFRDDDQLAYFRDNYSVASYKLDTYHLFIEQGLSLLKRPGLFSMITPANFLTNNHLASLRHFILEKAVIDHILVIEGGVFHGVSVDNAICVLCSSTPTYGLFPVIHASLAMEGPHETARTNVSASAAKDTELALFTGEGVGFLHELWDRMDKRTFPLGTIAHVNFGKQLRDRKTYTEDVVSLTSADDLPRHYKLCYTGRDVKRYSLTWGGLACLDQQVARRGGCWDPDKQNARTKIVTRQIGRYPDFALDTEGYQCLNTMFMVNPKGDGCSVLFILGVLNSSLIRCYWIDKFYDQRNTFPKIKGTYLKRLPIPDISQDEAADRSRHDRMVRLVEGMLRLHKELAGAKTPNEKETLERQIAATDAQIDQLVYELYGLTPDEIKIVEGASQ